ncbi:hypothetical protein [Neorhizobium galegae]|uniref:hypothetical protein n=1 Tax=Neorhizobium galegae TaxID=399 RepID=UPI000627C96C|nr:hypothetical protein [Neorhizobium galegae]KAB1121576.1 hypothetical protein F4V90_26015 [Neorhizobium galegae]MCQ1809359.1 hypothetical protein [Neorhizobium galegae]
MACILSWTYQRERKQNIGLRSTKRTGQERFRLWIAGADLRKHLTYVVYMAEMTTDSEAISAPSKRKTNWINRKPAANLLHAVNVAEILDRSLNFMVTLNFAHTACDPNQVSERFERLRDNYFGPWMRRCGPSGRNEPPPTFIWTIENAGGCLNVHWLVHLPAGRIEDFKARLPVWLEKVVGEVYAPDQSIHIRKAPTPRGAVKYMIKGIDPFYAPVYGIRQSDQGEVIGNRSNFSRSLGPAVKKALQAEGRMKPTRRIGVPRKGALAAPPPA